MDGSRLQCAPNTTPNSTLSTYRWPRRAYATASAAAAVAAAVSVRNTVRGVPCACRRCSGMYPISNRPGGGNFGSASTGRCRRRIIEPTDTNQAAHVSLHYGLGNSSTSRQAVHSLLAWYTLLQLA
eukprot:GHRQ01023864.1.p1 GENE.GHRQ01023864.1~~GHRQ01023864.1.p1  ORF type:complete len:126 (+),score=11.00 GHRQ01023864.1:581-958(+)